MTMNLPLSRPALFLLLAMAAATSPTTAAEQPMNVLVIQTDEHNFRTLGCYRELMSQEQAFIWARE